MHIKPLAHVTHAEVIALAQAAANRQEPLDDANVFEIGTNNHAVFNTEYLAHMHELEGHTSIGSAAEFTDFEIVVLHIEEVA
ncbi:hypothetical protein BH10PSE16_BH10PSE16_01130 [soil metagenome]